MSLEEAEPIPEISWSIRVLQPPPEQEHVQYGELGRGRGAPSPSSPAHSVCGHHSRLLSHILGLFEITSKRFFFLLWMVMGSSVQASEHLLWVSELGITRPDRLQWDNRAQRRQAYVRPL